MLHTSMLNSLVHDLFDPLWPWDSWTYFTRTNRSYRKNFELLYQNGKVWHATSHDVGEQRLHVPTCSSVWDFFLCHQFLQDFPSKANLRRITITNMNRHQITIYHDIVHTSPVEVGTEWYPSSPPIDFPVLLATTWDLPAKRYVKCRPSGRADQHSGMVL